MKFIPLFPLEIVVFPRERLNLHIFEPRYKQLIHDCKSSDLTFGIPYYQKDCKLEFGSTVKLDRIVKTYPNGRMDIATIGLVPMEVKRYVTRFNKKLYPGGYIEELYWEDEGDPKLTEKIREKLKDLYTFMSIKTIPEVLKKDFITFDIAHKVGFSQVQEYQLLQIVSEEDRQDYMIKHLEKLIPMVKQMEEMRQKIQMNGHFKNVVPPKL